MNETGQTVWAKAKDVLWERGWTRGTAQDKHGSLCLRGALAAVHGLVPVQGQFMGVVWESCAFAAGHLDPSLDAESASRAGGCVVRRWNDDPGRTFDDVLDLLDALDKAEREANP